MSSNISLSQDTNRRESSLVSSGRVSSLAEDSQSLSDLNRRTAQQEPAGFWKGFKDKIVNNLTTYRTNRDLRVRNRYLGYMAFAAISIIMGYFILYIFLIGRLFIQQEKRMGSPIISIEGKAYADEQNNMKMWELTQLMTGNYQSGSVTLPTRVRITKNQEIGNCPTPLIPCKNNDDCEPKEHPNFNAKGRCKELSGNKKGCEAQQWCPAEDIDNDDVTEKINLVGVGDQKITIKSAISFSMDPEKDSSSTRVTQIENLITLAGERYDNVKYTGCVLQVNVIWKCNLDFGDCETHFEVLRIDGGVGYSQKTASYHKEGDTVKRDEIHYSGIKLVVSVWGLAEKTSVVYLFLYIFAAVALLYGVELGTDFFLLHIAREKRHYADRKFEHLPSNNY